MKPQGITGASIKLACAFAFAGLAGACSFLIDENAFPFEGTRCTRGIDLAWIREQVPPRVRGAADCKVIESAAVRCMSDTDNLTTERWDFQACGKLVQVFTGISPKGRTITVDRPQPFIPPGAVSAAAVARSVSPEDYQRIMRLFDEASSLAVRGKLLDSRSRYESVLQIAPSHLPAQQNIAGLNKRIERANAAAAPFDAEIAKLGGTPLRYLNRAREYIRYGEIGRGVDDLERAFREVGDDENIGAQVAHGYLAANRPEEARDAATQVIASHPHAVHAYDARAWAGLLLGAGQTAHQDAQSSLMANGSWDRDSFLSERAAYRVVIGYFALRQALCRDRAVSWLREWKPYLDQQRWPDGFIYFLLGELGANEVRAIAKGDGWQDWEGEAVAFLGLESRLGAGFTEWEEVRKTMTRFFTVEWYSGHTFSYVLFRRMVTPSQEIQITGGCR